MTVLAASLWAALLWLWNITPLWAVPLLLIGVITAILVATMGIAWLALRLIEQWNATHPAGRALVNTDKALIIERLLGAFDVFYHDRDEEPD